MKTAFPRIGLAASVAALGLFAAAAPAAPRDEIPQLIEQARADYRRGDHDRAASRLEAAARSIRAARGVLLAQHLPTAPAGWFVSSTDLAPAGNDELGRAASARREFLRGERLVRVQILADAAAVRATAAGLAGTVSTVAPGSSHADGVRALRIGGQPAYLDYTAARRTGRVALAVARRILVTIDGVEVTPDELLAFAEATDIAGLAALR